MVSAFALYLLYLWLKSILLDKLRVQNIFPDKICFVNGIYNLVNIIGIFNSPILSSLFIQKGNNWKLLSGKKEGQTPVESSEFEDSCKWCFPLDIHLATNGIQGWPKFYIEVYNVDWLGLSNFYGYGFLTIPTSPGVHVIDCFVWRPFGSLREQLVQYFLGGGHQLKYADSILSANDRYKLNTESMGIVIFEINVILRNFQKFGIEYK